MAQQVQSDLARVQASAGHLSVHMDESGASEILFSFEQRRGRMLPSFASAIGLQVAILMTFVLLNQYGPTLVHTAPILPDAPNDQIIWLAQPGPGGGGGGGGNKMKEPPRTAELPGKDKISVPAVKPPAPVMESKPKPEPEPQLAQVNIPAVTLGASNETLPGLIDAPSSSQIASLGTGTGSGAGTGSGSGIGGGTGSGLGNGSGGGTGGGVYQPGNGVTIPVLLRKENPKYTPEAMRAKVQGIVVVACIVMPDGSVSNLRVVRSLDSRFGLDEQAIEAVRQWRFAPGRRMGQPVPVEISVELQFTLR